MVEYPQRESKSLEFKENLPKNLTAIIRTCVAFANTVGGEIIVGIQDKSRKIIGSNDVDIEKCFERLPNAIFDGIKPTIIPEVYERNFNDKTVIIIKISKGGQKPYFVRSEGVPKGVYVRVGPHTRRVNEDYLEELNRDQKRLTFDREVSTATFKDLDSNLLKHAYGQHTTKAILLREGILTCGDRDGEQVSNGGVLMFAHQPDQFISGASLMCTRFRGSLGRNIIESHEFAGSVPHLIETTFQQLLKWLERQHQLKSTKLRGRITLPAEAIREALTNAFIHRKYSIPGPIKVALYDDRLEVFNPGDFPGLVDINNLGDGSTYLRNPLMAKIGHKLRLIEKLGSGIPLIYASCARESLKQPQYLSDGDFVKLIFFFEKKVRAKKNLKHVIMEMFDEEIQLQTKDVLSRVSASRNTITNAFNGLIKEKKVRRIGSGRGAVYEKL